MLQTRLFSSFFLFFFLFISTLSNFLYFALIIHLISFFVCFEYLRLVKFFDERKGNSEGFNNLLLTRVKLFKGDFFLLLYLQISLFLFHQYFISSYFFLLIPIITVVGIYRSNLLKYLFIIYWLLPFYFLILIFHSGETIYFFTLFLIIAISTDVGAYVFGKIFKGPKIFKSISPNKTWSGFFGGNITTLITISIYFSDSVINVHFIITTVILSIICQIGDFVESYLKRCLNIKNSSNLIPGHGGVLDRLDGLTLLVNAIFLLYIFKFDFVSTFI